MGCLGRGGLRFGRGGSRCGGVGGARGGAASTGHNKAASTRPVLAWCPVPGCLWVGSGSVCLCRVCPCVLGCYTRSVGNAPLLIGCSVPDRVHGPVTGAAPPALPLLLVVVWLLVRVAGAFVPGCPRDSAASCRSESSTRYPRVLWAGLRPGCPCGVTVLWLAQDALRNTWGESIYRVCALAG